MSTAYSSAKQQYIGNGVTTEWGFDFPIKKHSELKVYLKRSASPQVLLEEGVDYSFVTDNTITFPIKTGEAKLQATDVLALQRESVFESEYNFSNQQRLEPEEVMHADDNLERQIQELKRDVTQAIRIQPTSNIDTDEYFVAVESIYENLDNITNVSGISAEIVNCSDNISDISTVSSNIANVNAVGPSISNVNTVAGNVSSVNTVAGVSTDVTAVASIASSVPIVANNDANITTVATNISDVNTAAANIEAIQDAPNQASSAQNSATQASQSATSASASAQAAQNALNEFQGLIATPIGTIFQSVYVDESLDISRRLNGQLISSTKFTGFRSWLNTVQASLPNLFTTETNWQAEKTNSKLGQCGKFVIDDTAGTIRLPCVVNAQGLVDLALIGGIKSESLPNISGYTDWWSGGYGSNNPTGAFTSQEATSQISINGGSSTVQLLSFDASRSSSTYQDNAPVQQEAVQYPYYIQVATGVEETLPAIREYKTNVPYVLGDSKYSETNPYNASWLVSNGQYNAKTTYPDMWSQLQVELNSSINKGDTVVIDGKTYVKRGLPVKLSTATYTDYDWVVNTGDETFRLPLLNGSEDLPGDRFEDWKSYVTGTETNLPEAPANGYVTFAGNDVATKGYLYVNNNELNSSAGQTTSSSFRRDWVQVKKGDVVHIYIDNISGVSTLRFNYAKGNGTLYYYVGDTVQDASLINAGAVLGQLSNKADIDASNFNADGKSLLSGLGMPSGRYIDLTLGASDSTYTAPANGYFTILGAWNTEPSQTNSVFISMSCGGMNTRNSGILNRSYGVFIPAKKGQSMYLEYSNFKMTGYSYAYFRFVYAEGENNV